MSDQLSWVATERDSGVPIWTYTLAVDAKGKECATHGRGRYFTRDKLATWIRQADERIEEHLSHVDRADRHESEGGPERAAGLKAKIAKLRNRCQGHAAMLSELVTIGESQVSLTDHDSRGTATNPKVSVGYNAQDAVNAKHKMLVERHVANAGSDLGLLAHTAGAAKELLGVDGIDAVADMGCYKGEDIAACEEIDITPYVARPQGGAAVAAGRFAEDQFAYGFAGDIYRCPGGHPLEPGQQSEKINALKHAFPTNQVGHIVVDYAAEDLDWTLSVSHDGVGMSTQTAPPPRGLGTSIVQAIATKLQAANEVVDLAPGTRVSLLHGRRLAFQGAATGPADFAV